MNGCFGCDPANRSGLGMIFYRDAAGRLAARCRPSNAHRGLGKVVHGGLVASFGEELAALEAGAKGDGGLLAAEMNCKFERPAYVESELSAVVTGSRVDGRRVHVTVEVTAGGERVSVVESTFVLISEDKLRSITGIGLGEAPACLVAGRGELPVLSG
jgi:acyl-coenzyme A thioesterase PaaI-like protein